MTGNVESDPAVVKAVQERGAGLIDLPDGLGSFGFVVIDAARGEIMLTGPVARSATQKE